MPPPGLLRLGGALIAHGVDVELDDLAYRLGSGEIEGGDALARSAAQRLLARHADHAFDAIGLSVMGATVPIALAILQRLRADAPEVELWLGGPGVGGLDVALLERFACVDRVVRGEGESTVLELCDARARRTDARGIAGVTWRAPDGAIVREIDREPIKDLGKLPPYAWHLLPSIAEYKRITGGEDGLVPIDSGRGCVFDCSFCSIGRFWQRRSRTLPARKLALEIASLAQMESARSAYLCHDLFGANRGQAVALCEALCAADVRVPWEVRARADHLDAELLALMGRAGCYRVLIGVESANANVRARNQKGMRDDVDVLAVVMDCDKAGIVPILSLILGLPGEDDSALRASLDFCAEACRRASVQVSLHLVNPQPGCALGDEFGARSRRVEGIPPDMAWGSGETEAERALIAAHPDLFTTWALLPQDEAHLRRLHAIASTLPEVLMRYPRTWARLLRADTRRIATAAGRPPDTLDLFDAWQASGTSFESYALAARDALVEATLAWEQAKVRVAARGEAREKPVGVRFRGELLTLTHDVTSDDAQARDTCLAVIRSGRGVATVRVSAGVAELLRSLDGSASAAELEVQRPGIGKPLAELAKSGLVDVT